MPERVAQVHDERVEVIGQAASGRLIASVLTGDPSLSGAPRAAVRAHYPGHHVVAPRPGGSASAVTLHTPPCSRHIRSRNFAHGRTESRSHGRVARRSAGLPASVCHGRGRPVVETSFDVRTSPARTRAAGSRLRGGCRAKGPRSCDGYRLARRPALAACSSAETTSAIGAVVTIS